MRNSILLCLGVLLAISACVPNRKILYLQKNDLSGKKQSTDSVIRDYSLRDFDYKVQANDILSIRYTSLTEEIFDVTNQQGSSSSSSGSGGSSSSVGGALLRGEIVDDRGEI